MAARLFATDGYKGTSLQDIAATVGCSKATLLYHFATKEMILATLLAPPVRELVTLTEQLAGLPAAAAQNRAIEGFVDLVLTYRREIALIFHDLTFLFNEASFADLRDLTDVLGSALAGGASDPAAQVTAKVMMAGIALITVDPVESEGVDLRSVLVDVARRALAPTR